MAFLEDQNSRNRKQ
jgi:hypothetical protein